MFHFTLLDEIFDGIRYILNGDIGINSMLVEEINMIRLKPLQATLHFLKTPSERHIESVSTLMKPPSAHNGDEDRPFLEMRLQ
jgi:hypothetical protein